MARPAQKKQRLTPSNTPVTTPTKSAKANGKARQVLPPRQEGDEDEEEDEDGEEEQEEEDLPPGESMGRETTGDNYFHKMAEKNPPTSSQLLSTFIDPAFTLSSYAEALATSDSSDAPALVAQRKQLSDRKRALEKNLGKWTWELEQGFNILLYGFGSKRDLMISFAEKLRKKGNVVMVNGYDLGAGLGDILEALEGLVKPEEEVEEVRSPSKSPRKGKGKAKQTSPSKSKAKPTAPKLGSALEGRTRRFCRTLATAPESTKDVFLLINSLDGPALRGQKALSLLALLAAQPRLHLIASVDHIRAPLIFPTSLATARPVISTVPGTSSSQEQDQEDEESETTRNLEAESSAFTFLYHEASTLAPFASEILTTSILSTLLPQSIYPRINPLLSSSSSTTAQSTVYVLQSVSDSSKKLFRLLADLQIAAYTSLSSSEARLIQLNPTSTSPSPIISSGIQAIQKRAQEMMIIIHRDKLGALLAEFKDHGVVRTGEVAPENWEEEDESNSWIWIPLGMEELEEVRETLEGMMAG